ncbi:MAG: hypothetical protein KIS92_10225 [Planctomycetota bacterium]|nr:hypothetical protein [Planctomycetota bacterium]
MHMRSLRWSFALLLLLAGSLTAAETGPQVTARHGQSLRGTLHGMPVLVLRGTHRERGEAYGFLAARDILNLMEQAFIPLLGLKARDAQAWDKYADIQKKFVWPERYKQALEGMFEGIRLALPDPAQRRLPSLGREVTLRDLYFLNCIYDIKSYSCSSFAAWGSMTADGETLIGRNFDGPKVGTFDYGRLFLLIAEAPAEKDCKATLDIRSFGYLGATTVMNEDGVFASIHEANDRRGYRTEGWTPRILCFRNAIETARAGHAVEDMTAELRRLPVRVGSIVLAGGPARGPGSAGVLEWDGGALDQGVTVRLADEASPEFIACANHFVRRPCLAVGDDTKRRYQCQLDPLARCRADGRKVDVESAKKQLAGAEALGEAFTLFSVVAQPKQRRLHLAISPKTDVSASKGAWFEVKWDDVFGMK